MWAFFKTRLLCGKQGNLLWERKIGEATHADFSSSSPYFSVYFALFSLLSLFFMKGNFVHFVVLTTLKRGFALSDDGYRTIIYTQNFNIAEPLKKKKHAFVTQFIYRNYRFSFFLFSAFFSVHIFPVASALHRYPVLVLQTLSCFVVWLDIKEQKIIMLSNKEKKTANKSFYDIQHSQEKKTWRSTEVRFLTWPKFVEKLFSKCYFFFLLMPQ